MESGLGDFIQQIPPGPILMMCGSAVLLVIVLIFIVRARVRKNQARLAEAAGSASAPPMAAPSAAPMGRAAAYGDLPDLDLLVSVPAAPLSPPAQSRPARKGTFSLTLNDGSITDAVEVMTILRDVVDGGLVVQMGDKTYRNLANDEATKANFMKIMRELANIVKPGSAPVSVEAPASAPPTALAETAPEAEPAALRDLLTPGSDEPDPVLLPAGKPYVPPPPAAGGAMPGDLPKFDLDQKIEKKKGGFLGRGKLELPPVPELNIAGAIEAYLQHKLRFTPGYEARSIHVHPAPDGGVSIEVDGRFFDAVGDVDDAEVRQFLASTIQEWQQRH